jgi:hypothetical protein
MTESRRRYLVPPEPTHVPQHDSPESTQAERRSPGLVLLSRVYCHLCDDMLAALAGLGHRPAVVDVDADPALEAQWGEKVPVLLYEGREVCHYHLDTVALRAALS